MAAKSEGAKEEKEKSGKRGHYKRAECPYCHKVKGNLKNHILQMHPTEAAERAEAAPGLDVEVLTGKKKAAEIPAQVNPEDVTYYCMSCKAELRQGEKFCWNCKQGLIWG